MNKLFIIGAGGHGRVAIDIAVANGYVDIGIIDVNFNEQEEKILGFPVLGNLSYLLNITTGSHEVFVALGDNAERKTVYHTVANHGFKMINLLHPTATVSRFADLAKGVLVGAGAHVATEVGIGNGSIINTRAIVEHETSVGEFTHIGPGVCVAGRVNLGDLTFVGIGSVIIDKVDIGNNVVIGAGSTIIRNIADDSRVVGVSKSIGE